MRIPSLILAVLLVAVLAGCSGKEEELQRLNDDLEQRNVELNQDLSARDQYIADMVSSVNAVYSGLEIARKEEATLLRKVSAEESDEIVNNPDIRQQVIQRVSALGNMIETNKKKVRGLQTQLASANKNYKGLEEMVGGLKKNIEEREQSLAQLEATINDLNAQVEAKQQEVAERDSKIQAQQTQINTVYYIVGTRQELEEKGIIQDEGGFPWGLFGSTTVLASGVDESLFTPVDKTMTSEFTIDGEVDEIIPLRSANFYLLESVNNQSTMEIPAAPTNPATVVRVTDGKRFWQDKFLVIIKD